MRPCKEMMRSVFVGGIIPAEVMVAVGEVDVALVEDGCPLERSLPDLCQSFVLIMEGTPLTPCSLWHVVQWQYLAARGLSRLSSYCTFPQ